MWLDIKKNREGLIPHKHLSVLPYDKAIRFLYNPSHWNISGYMVCVYLPCVSLMAPGSSFPRFLPAAYITSDAETNSGNVHASKEGKSY